MTLNLSMPGYDELKPRITVFGVGGAGGNAVDNMIDKNLDGVDFVVGNTDAQALQQSKSETRIQLGVKVTEGLGAGARASVGAAAAEEIIWRALICALSPLVWAGVQEPGQRQLLHRQHVNWVC